MDEEAGFTAAIAATPDDDTPRLVYADWLDEHNKPDAADYLRTEVELARLPLGIPETRILRARLWQAWASVEPAWLMTFTQPRMLRANPTPFPIAWKNFRLGSLRPGGGTYGTWPYDSIPALPLDELRGEFQYLKTGQPPVGGLAEVEMDCQATHERMLAAANERGVRLPDSFLRFMSDASLHRVFPSVTGCFFTHPDEYSPIRSGLEGEGTHVHFYCDSQHCLLWDLYVHPSGGHCVVARWLDYFDPEPPDPDDEEPPYTGPRAWFVAPSFEAFIYRVWLENQVWDIEHADFLRNRQQTPPPITPAIQQYMDHYRKQQSEA